jgi:hypothetical protein
VSGTGPQAIRETIVAGEGGVAVRARVRRVVPEGPDLLAYTNAVRVQVR